MQNTLVQLRMFEEESSDEEKSTLSLSGRLAKISVWQESVQGLKENGAVLSGKQLGLYGRPDLRYLSGRTLKECSAQTVGRILRQSCRSLPTLGAIDLNGSCLIQDGFYPKIESGYTLSDILQDEVSGEYFLSEAMKVMLSEQRGGHRARLVPHYEQTER